MGLDPGNVPVVDAAPARLTPDGCGLDACSHTRAGAGAGQVAAAGSRMIFPEARAISVNQALGSTCSGSINPEAHGRHRCSICPPQPPRIEGLRLDRVFAAPIDRRTDDDLRASTAKHTAHF